PWQHAEVTRVDTRQGSLDITDQVILTADKINLRLSLYAVYRVVDAVLAVHEVDSYHGRLYREVQLAARQVVSQHTLDELLQTRNLLGQTILEDVAPKTGDFGLETLQVAARGVILPGEVRQHFMELVAQRQQGQAAIQAARDEVAATRALLNAARLVREHPELMRLKELQTLAQISQQGQLVIAPLGAPPAVAVVADGGGQGHKIEFQICGQKGARACFRLSTKCLKAASAFSTV
ncbi:MAG: slipin family protein, partial [Delftia sp.]|nr:slipin family protein [Delftia sp.]